VTALEAQASPVDAATPPLSEAEFPPLLDGLLEGRDLSRDDARRVMEAIVSGALSPVRTAALLAALRAKRESPDEVAGLAMALRARCKSFPLHGIDAIDCCGTGGDGAGTFNVSTAAAFVAAGAGAMVAKHGNRAVSSKAGSADVLEALGFRLELTEPAFRRSVLEAGMGFLFAPAHHAALRHAAPVRRDLGVKTALNILGPLANPAGVLRQVTGVFEARLVPLVAGALARLGARAAIVVHGATSSGGGDGRAGAGLDEVSISGPTRVAIVSARADGALPDVTLTEWEPRASFGVEPVSIEALVGGDAARNARMVREALSGAISPLREIVVVNAAAALVVAGLARDTLEGAARARESIDSGRARAALEAARRLSLEGEAPS